MNSHGASAARRIPPASWRRRSRGCRTRGVNRTAPILPWGAPRRGDASSRRSTRRRRTCSTRGGVGTRAWRRGNRRWRSTAGRAAHRAGVVRRGSARADRRAAARRPGSTNVTLLEEPQAAFYAWLDSTRRSLARAASAVGDLVLVVRRRRRHDRLQPDRGRRGRDGDLALERVAVGDHILLGGDNMDLALARLAAAAARSRTASASTRGSCTALWHQCRVAKEALFADPAQSERIR